MHQQNQQNQQNYQQMQGHTFQPQQQPAQSLLPEKDWLFTILCDLKRASREYTTAVTECNTPSLRQVFTDLLNSTLSLQGQLYQLMSQNNMYNAPSQAGSQEIQKQIQSSQQSGQEAFQFAQQKIAQQSQPGPSGFPANAQVFNQH